MIDTSALNVSPETAALISDVLSGRVDPCDVSPKTKWWKDRCYGRVSKVELQITACDELLETHGVECLNGPGEVGGYYDGTDLCPRYSYCNMGDPYIPTVVRDHREQEWLIAAWGDLVEDTDR